MNHEERFKQYLKEQGLKFTPERKAVLAEVYSFQGHFTADELCRNLSGRKGTLSRATVYRTLPLLIECKLIRETPYSEGGTNYEHVLGDIHHDHLVCVKCGRIIEFIDEDLERAQDRVCKRFQFTSIDHKLGIKGYCKKCQASAG